MSGHSRFRSPFTALLAAACIMGVAAFGAQTPDSGSTGRREGFSPVAPPAAVRAALKTNLKLVNDWLSDRDFASAAETAEGLVVLANVYQCYSDQSAWREKAASLREACEDLVTRAKTKDAAGCDEASRRCATLLAELGEKLPSGDRPSANDFKPPSSTKTLMKLMDGTYADAKRAKSVSELSNMLLTIAEVANVARVMRNEPNWQERATAVRAAALNAAQLKPDADLQAARRELKNVYERCQACHKEYRP
jgi:cytochrome c556